MQIVIIIVFIIAAGIGAFFAVRHRDTGSVPTENSASLPAGTPVPQSDTSTVSTQGSVSTESQVPPYKNGTYTEAAKYMSPAGSESMRVTLTLTEGVVTDSQVVGEATHPISMKNQRNFITAYKEQVIGKPIADLNLTVVNGASLSTKGFMGAVEAIKSDAKG